MKSTTFQVSELVQKLTERISSKENLIFNGFDCQVLRLGSGGWVKGKIKLALEFYPDEQEASQMSEKQLSKNSKSESPLDDLREKFNQEN
ncbi:KGK domain-containing protein [Okeania sp. SIO2B3]|uniref:KGK domain-containing protein n=1 Tax=Okeania sp. SIO2B3 TaxID=2607784 RepID=UPI0034456C8C